MADAYERISGMKNEFILAHGTSYAKAMKNFVAWGPYFPGEEDSCHEVNEHIAFDTLICAAKIYKEALYNMALSTESLIK
jgi:succinyl-diaminopimelate desuccinylase